QYKPQDIIITNIDYDHPDYFKTEDDYVSAFQEFVDSLDAEGSVVIEHKEKDTLNISSKVITYSIDDKEADYYALRTSIISGNQQFLVYEKGKPIGNFQIAVPGMHNISNALAVIAYLR
ncbi:MAG: Mur ligase family protein, partial [Patescibacteria group bacterium]|nr:Mur ligase family protein [Patescibacteria group bacterium]